MKPCKRVGINVTHRCNAKCLTCFYRFSPEFNSNYHKPIEEVKHEIDAAKMRGCDHAVLVGYGEPTLYPYLQQFVEYCTSIGFTSSMITNGTTGVSIIEKSYGWGMDHIHMSVHGLGQTLNEVLDINNADINQEKAKQWLKVNNKKWRSNTTLQKSNYKQLPDIISNIIDNGAYHVILLGFLPHYEWHNKLNQVAVHPQELRPYIEKCCEILEKSNTYFTIRYHPMCHLDQKYWKYVVNARYVLFDPLEWDYEKLNSNMDIMWNHAVQLGDSVSIKGKPCSDCVLKLHCGGWNQVYANGFNGANLRAIGIDEVGMEYIKVIDIPGGLHDLNPINSK